MKIYYDNNVFNSTITSSTENPLFPFELGLQDTRLTRVGRTLGKLNQSIVFYNANGFTTNFGYISNANISPTASVKLQFAETDVWTTPAASYDMAYSSDGYWTVEVDEDVQNNLADEIGDLNVDEVGDFLVEEYNVNLFPYQYCRILIDDISNVDGYIQIGYVFFGYPLVMPGMSPDQAIPFTSNDEVTKSISGQIFADIRVKLKGGKVVFPVIEESKRQEVITFYTSVGRAIPFLLMFWEDDLDVEPPLYCALTKDIENSKNPQEGLTWTTTIEVEECK